MRILWLLGSTVFLFFFSQQPPQIHIFSSRTDSLDAGLDDQKYCTLHKNITSSLYTFSNGFLIDFVAVVGH